MIEKEGEEKEKTKKRKRKRKRKRKGQIKRKRKRKRVLKFLPRVATSLNLPGVQARSWEESVQYSLSSSAVHFFFILGGGRIRKVVIFY